jgi:hypothetical protein
MSKEKTIKIKLGKESSITVNLTGDGGWAMTTEGLKTPGDPDGIEEQLFNAAVDGLESIILAHAVQGIDIEAPAYVQGIKDALQAIDNHF